MTQRKHKAATQISIASTTEESALQQLVERYWKPALGVALVASVLIMLLAYRGNQRRESAAASWDRLRQEVTFGPGQIQAPSGPVLASISTELGGELAAPWAKALEVSAHVKDEDFDAAERALGELEASWPDHDLVALSLPFAEEEARATLPAHLRVRMRALPGWEKEHGFLFGLADLAADAPRVKLVTSSGEILVGLYAQRAPKHTENFLKLCGEGFYDETLFHRVMANFMIQGGDPNTKDEGKEDEWGVGGPGYTIAPELSDLKHFQYALAAAKKDGEVQSSGSQFYITTGTPHHLDGLHTVFGRVLEGESVVDAIGSAAVVGEKPEAPVKILSTEVL